jgi:hypothetical protein
MTILLVNTSPGDDSSLVNPSKPIYMGVKSQLFSVVLGSLNVRSGYSSVDFNGVLPISDPILTNLGSTISFDPAELYKVAAGSATATMESGYIKFVSTSTNQADKGVYSVSYPCTSTNSIMGYIKFKKASWSTSAADWAGNSLATVAPVYFSLEYGPSRTSYTVFLTTNGGAGELKVAGPAPYYSNAATRSGLVTYTTLNWNALLADQSIELWIMFNIATSNVELWGRLEGQVAPTNLGNVAISSLGTFPLEHSHTGYQNFRNDVSNQCTMYFGLGGGLNAQTLKVTDWALFPDFRHSILDGTPTSNATVKILPDCPVEYRAASNLIPNKVDPGRWLSGATPANATLFYQPGRRLNAYYSSFTRASGSDEIVFKKEEPKIAELADGVMMEGYISGTIVSRSGNDTNVGFGLEDGAKSYYLHLLNDSSDNPTYGILSNAVDPNSFGSYYTPTANYDYERPHLVRMVVDRYRSKLLMFVDDVVTPVKTINLPGAMPVSPTAKAYIKFGHFSGTATNNSLNVLFFNYMPVYKAWEGIDGLIPSNGALNSAVKFTQNSTGAGNSSSTYATGTTIVKAPFNTANSKLTYSKTEPLGADSGVQVDFRANVSSYKDINGSVFGLRTHTGVGLIVYLGLRKVAVKFYNCGIHGKKIAIVPGSGTESDILDQTTLGRAFSADIDWTDMTNYRLVIKARDSIKLWVGSILNNPVITIPWLNDAAGFDLPADGTTPSVEFGHFDYDSSSVSNWEFVRWGISNGYEVSVTHQYPSGIDKSQYSGRTFELVTVSDA